MCCMLSTFHVSSQIVADISERGLNSSLCLGGGKHHQKITIPVLRLVLRNVALPGGFPYILFSSFIFFLISSGWFVIALFGAISLQGTILRVDCGFSIWGKIITQMYRLWLHGLYGLHGSHCPLLEKKTVSYHRHLNCLSNKFVMGTSRKIRNLQFCYSGPFWRNPQRGWRGVGWGRWVGGLGMDLSITCINATYQCKDPRDKDKTVSRPSYL